VRDKINILKGTHPGLVLERELKKRGLSKGRFALAIQEYPSTFSSILKGKRNMNTTLAMRIESELGIEEGFFMTLQVFYDIEQEKRKRNAYNRPDLTQFRPALFWDTQIDKINWELQKDAVIDRIFSRGNLTEKKEILKFYGHDIVRTCLSKKRKAEL
jgi:antitoxin HigA-1